ncbi:MAG: hypothetical protein V4549_09330, partial [Bacteroidota bacterium]
MKSKILLSVAFILLGTYIWAQSSNSRPAKKNQDEQVAKNGNTTFFKILDRATKIDVKNDIRDAVFLELDFAELARINKEKPSSLILDLPLSDNSNATFYLKTAKVVSDNFSLLTGNNEKVDYTPGLY